VALDLQGRGELLSLLGEIGGQDPDLLDGFSARDRLVRVVDCPRSAAMYLLVVLTERLSPAETGVRPKVPVGHPGRVDLYRSGFVL